mmetsp:Transcript_16224/g.34085  ORF Transcript_16224/g.34085 Transcript_16224/m.34085 type:complete len:284 (+) Transcript_16224:771-1622(+)
MSRLVVGNELVLSGGEHGSSSLLFEPDHNAVNGSINLFPSDGGLALACCCNCSFVHEILELGSRKSWGTTSNGLEIDIGFQGLATGVHTEDAGASLEVGEVDGDLPIKTSRTQQGLIQNVNTVSSRDGNDSRVSVETIHLNQNLVNCLFALVVSTSKSRATLTTDRIDFINEDDARGVLLRLSEHVANTGRSDSNKHLNELRSRNRNERDSSFSGDGFGKKGFTSSRGAVQNHSPGNSASIFRIYLRLLQKVDYFGKFQFGTVATGDVFEVDSGIGDHLNLSL